MAGAFSSALLQYAEALKNGRPDDEDKAEGRLLDCRRVDLLDVLPHQWALASFAKLVNAPTDTVVTFAAYNMSLIGHHTGVPFARDVTSEAIAAASFSMWLATTVGQAKPDQLASLQVKAWFGDR